MKRKEEKHGLTNTPEYNVWRTMKARCHTPTNRDYYLYGDRGISVCEEWRNSFSAFIRDMGFRPGKGYSLDRIDSNGNYEPGNCRWTTDRVQTRNKRSNRKITYLGKTQSLVEWAEELDMDTDALRYRLDKGWSIEDAFYKPSRYSRGLKSYGKKEKKEEGDKS